MATRSAAPKTTVNVGGVPYTATSAAKATALAGKGTPATTTGTSGAPPAQGQSGWIDPIRGPGDTTYTDKYGAPPVDNTTPAGIDTQTPGGVAQPAAPVPAVPVAPPTAANTPVSQGNATTTTEDPTATYGAASVTPTQKKYQTGLAATVASGAPPPSTAGAAALAVKNAATAPPDTTALDNTLSADPQIDTLMKGITKLLQPDKQTTTLMQDYQSLYKSSGLADINHEIIDAETVINGTEGDVRNEIQKAGGFGTDSQVQAMSLARNKSLLTRYNQLVQQKTDATNQLNTMMQLDSSDKQMAAQKVQSNISNMFSMANFRQQAINNSREQFNFMTQQVGLDGLYDAYKNSPNQLANIEKVMGIQQGGLVGMAGQAAKDRARKQYIENQGLAIQRGQLAVSQGHLALDIAKAKASKPKTATGAERQDLAFFNRAFQASKDVAPIENSFAGNPLKAGGLGLFGLFQTSDQKSYSQAQRAFTEARLRKESGAGIPNSEYANDAKTYFVQPGDGAAQIAQKQQARAQVLEGLRFSAGSAYNEFYGHNAISKLNVGGQTYYVGQIVTNSKGQSGIVLPDGSIEVK